MIKGYKTRKDEYIQCTSCLKDNSKDDICIIKIGKTERQAVAIKLCNKCLAELTAVANLSDTFSFESEV